MKSSRSAAFTIIELLVVIAIIAVMTTLAISAFSGSSKSGADLTRAGGTASGLAQLARQTAMSQNTKMLLVLAEINDNGVTRSALSIWDPSTTNQVEKWNLLPEAIHATNSSTAAEATETIDVTYRNQPVSGTAYPFYSDGRMGDGNAAPRLMLKARTGSTNNTYELLFSPLTGTIKVLRP